MRDDDGLSPAAERGIELFSAIVVIGLIAYFDVFGVVRRFVQPYVAALIQWLGWFSR